MSSVKKCKNCNKENEKSAKTCAGCGAKQKNTGKTIAIVAAIVVVLTIAVSSNGNKKDKIVISSKNFGILRRNMVYKFMTRTPLGFNR